ncbi:hypothetical protein BDN72DRAFT_861592 [Pluteus cervinus]|uniref:Uncharacterized protein n=1 Tax=Pluteus cervinus TaxID=181527 RepID=A0ACD3AGZ6_9AGAR|nr:hypothetical protein BDN72DRAFT_861592 [Pluteus cervinus]
MSIPPNQIVILPESGTILELLLQYMYHQPQPDLSLLDFDTLIALGEAAEKYQVYSALEICRVYLSLSIPDHPLRVLSFALKHNRTSLIDEAAKETIGEPLEGLISALQPHHFVAWVKYHRAWMDTLSKVYQFRDPLLRHWEGSKDADGPGTKLMVNPCEVWAELWGTVAHQLQGKPEMLLQIDEVFRQTRELLGLRCRACERLIVDWQAEVEWGLEKIPKLSTYL